MHDRLTDDENFAELPAVEVMNKVSEEEAKSRAQSEYNKSQKSGKSTKVINKDIDNVML